MTTSRWPSVLLLLSSCGGEGTPSLTPGSGVSGSTDGAPGDTRPGGGDAYSAPVVPPAGPNGNPAGRCAVPAAGLAEDSSKPTTVVGDGTPASCTGAKVAAAVKAGGVVTFSCGSDPIVIAVPELRIFNNGGKGDGSVTIDGEGARRIIYQNTCDESLVFTTATCNTQEVPRLVLQNIGFTRGKGPATDEQGGGGAVYVRGGTFKMFGVCFFDNELANVKQDYAGGAVYATSQVNPVYVVNSTFERNKAANGGALGSIGVSWTVLNSAFSANATTGRGMNPAKPGTPGGGLGGAIYNDGNAFTLTSCGTLFENNEAAELGSGSIFMVSNSLSGDLSLTDSTFRANANGGAVQGTTHPSIYVEARDKQGENGITIASTTFE